MLIATLTGIFLMGASVIGYMASSAYRRRVDNFIADSEKVSR
jgi:hypothetical protein